MKFMCLKRETVNLGTIQKNNFDEKFSAKKLISVKLSGATQGCFDIFFFSLYCI